MRKILIIVALVAGCRNDAISYMHAADPDATCSAVHTARDQRDYTDTATCVSRGHVYACQAPSYGLPSCEDRGPILRATGQAPAERIWP